MIGKSLGRHRDVGLILLRLGVGGAMVVHGWPKISGGTAFWNQLGTMAHMPMPTVMGFIGALAEFGGGILFAAGLLFRPVSAILTIQMIVALMTHLTAADPTMRSFNMYSHALELLFVFLGMIFVGPGSYSVDGADDVPTRGFPVTAS